jgi:hypothetical protein
MSAVRLPQRNSWFGLVVLLAASALGLVTWWLLAGGIGRDEALKTGGLAAGSFVALYALWLNDRRRRTEEERREIERARQDLEGRRAEHDRERVADERFARAVELLGNGADQARVGALHALAGLARSRPEYTQTVLDVLCAYLRSPFDHYRYAEIRGEDWKGDKPAVDRELQVRFAAQRLITDLLPHASIVDAPVYDLDLHAATLEYFDLAERVVGQIRARQTNLYESNALSGARVHGVAWFTGARCWGRLHAHDVEFRERAWFSRFQARGAVDLAGCDFRGPTKFADADFAGAVSFVDAKFAHPIDFTNARFRDEVDLRVSGGVVGRTHAMKVSLKHEHHLPDGWQVDRTHGPDFGLVRA